MLEKGCGIVGICRRLANSRVKPGNWRNRSQGCGLQKTEQQKSKSIAMLQDLLPILEGAYARETPLLVPEKLQIF